MKNVCMTNREFEFLRNLSGFFTSLISNLSQKFREIQKNLLYRKNCKYNCKIFILTWKSENNFKTIDLLNSEKAVFYFSNKTNRSFFLFLAWGPWHYKKVRKSNNAQNFSGYLNALLAQIDGCCHNSVTTSIATSRSLYYINFNKYTPCVGSWHIEKRTSSKISTSFYSVM